MIGQYYPETAWEIARLGKITASKIHVLFTEPKSKAAKEAGELSETAKTYLRSRAAELITGQMRGVSTNATEWGKRVEPIAVEMLEQIFPGLEYYGVTNQQFFPYCDHSGGSPDCVHGDRIVFEGKCPEDPANHVEYCLMRTQDDLLKEHYFQVQFNMACVAKKKNQPFTEMQGVFFSFYPEVREGFPKMKLIKVSPDMDFYAKLDGLIERATIYLAEVIDDMKKESELLLQPSTF